MNASGNTKAVDYTGQPDVELVRLILLGYRGAFREVMQRCNQRLFRIARGVVNNDSEAEDVVQEAYMRAFEKLSTFRGDASLLTWLGHIVINEARGRLRRERPNVDFSTLDTSTLDDSHVVAFRPQFGQEDPATDAARAQMRGLIEHAIAKLPPTFRVVFVMREIEQCTVEETASLLGIRPETVKTRLHRARRLLRAELEGTLLATLTDAFPFLGARCEQMTLAILEQFAPTGGWKD